MSISPVSGQNAKREPRQPNSDGATEGPVAHKTRRPEPRGEQAQSTFWCIFGTLSEARKGPKHESVVVIKGVALPANVLQVGSVMLQFLSPRSSSSRLPISLSSCLLYATHSCRLLFRKIIGKIPAAGCWRGGTRTYTVSLVGWWY